jgi:hypothetical protein
MQCYFEPDHLNQPPSSHPKVTFYRNGKKKWPKLVQDRFNTFCVSNPLHRLNIYCHHIVLRCILGHRHLAVLSRKSNDKQGELTFLID